MSDLIFPLTQSEEFERTCKKVEIPVQRFSDSAGSCLVQSRRFPIIGAINLISRGPVQRGNAGVEALLTDVRRSTRGPLFVNPPAGFSSNLGLKIAREAKLAIIDIEAPGVMRQKLHQKWRNQLRKAENAPLRVLNQPLEARRHRWFLEAEQAQQKVRKYRAHPTGFLLAYAAVNEGQARVFTAMDGLDPVAAMLVLKHGRMATYQAGIITHAGKAYCAHNLLLWSIMNALERKGVRHLDLGRSDLSNGLRRFKLGAGAREDVLPGTYWARGWGKHFSSKANFDTLPFNRCPEA